jgi:hypothetical protein
MPRVHTPALKPGRAHLLRHSARAASRDGHKTVRQTLGGKSSLSRHKPRANTTRGSVLTSHDGRRKSRTTHTCKSGVRVGIPAAKLPGELPKFRALTPSAALMTSAHRNKLSLPYLASTMTPKRPRVKGFLMSLSNFPSGENPIIYTQIIIGLCASVLSPCNLAKMNRARGNRRGPCLN